MALRTEGTTTAAAQRDFVMLACAADAGIHGALIPEHLAEGSGPGGGFVAATLLLAVLAVGLGRPGVRTATLVATALTLAGLLASYAVAITSGLPLLHPEVEPVNGLAVASKAVEGVALLASLHPLRRRRTALPVHSLRLKGTSS
jgi:hypothetical protein